LATRLPKVRSRSAGLKICVAWFIGPCEKYPRKAVTAVDTPVIVWTPLGSSST